MTLEAAARAWRAVRDATQACSRERRGYTPAELEACWAYDRLAWPLQQAGADLPHDLPLCAAYSDEEARRLMREVRRELDRLTRRRNQLARPTPGRASSRQRQQRDQLAQRGEAARNWLRRLERDFPHLHAESEEVRDASARPQRLS